MTLPLANFAVTNATTSQCQIFVSPTPSGYDDTLVVLGTMAVQSFNLSYTYNYTNGIPTQQGIYYPSGVNIVASLASATLSSTYMAWNLTLEGANPFWQNQSLLINQPPYPQNELLMPYIQADFVSTNPSGIYLIDIVSSNWLTFSN